MWKKMYLMALVAGLMLPAIHAVAQVDKMSTKPVRVATEKPVVIRDANFKKSDVLRHDQVRKPADPTKPAEPKPANPEDLEREGPANKTFNVANQILSDFDFTGDKVLNIYNTVFRDNNIKSGYYYYLPASYSLNWTASTGSYDFQATYGTASADGKGKVTVTAILRPRLSKNDLLMAQEILGKNIKGKPEEPYGIKELISVPMAQSPEISFTNLSQFGVGDKDISMRAPSDLSDPIYISFTTDRIDELMAMFFNNIGLYGDVLVYPDGQDMPTSIRIPFNLKIDAPETFGKFELLPSQWRANRWQNLTDYPVALTNFHVLKKEADGNFKVYTWTAGDIEVPEGAMVNFDATTVPGWIDNSASVRKIWLDYTIQPCASCNSNVKKKIIGSVNTGPTTRPEKLEFTILTPMDFTKASLMRIKVRSYQTTTEGTTKQELPSITVKNDGDVLDGGTLYVKNGTVDFEYLIQVYMEDGTKYESAWIHSTSREVVIGSAQIKQNISYFSNK